MLVLWCPPWIIDRVRYSEPGVCFWDPSLNKEFVFIIAILGHHGPYLFMMFCYIYVFIFMHKRAKVGDWIGRARGSGGERDITSVTRINMKPEVSTSLTGTSVAKAATEASFTTNVKPVQPDVPSSAFSNNHVAVSFLKPPGNPHVSQHNDSTDQSAASRQRRETKVFITLTYIVVAYGVLWLPFHVVFDISIVDPTLVPENVLNMAFWMAYVNSTVNPFLYNFSSVEFRKTFKRLLLGKRQI